MNKLVSIGTRAEQIQVETATPINGLPAAKSIVTNPSPITGAGPVQRNVTSGLTGMRAIPKSLTFVLNNNTSSPQQFIFFDAAGFLQAAFPSAGRATLSSGIPLAVIDKVILGNPLLAKGFNYRITSGNAGQFANSFKKVVSDLNGNSSTEVIDMAPLQRNNQFNDLILTSEEEIVVDLYTGFTLTVQPSTQVQVDIFIGTIYDRLQ